MREYKINLRYFFLMICIYLFVFQNFLQEHSHLLKYFDEILTIISIPIILVNLLNKKYIKEHKKIVIYLLIIITIGIIGNIIFKYQKLSYIVPDIIAVIKFFCIMLLSYITFNSDFISKFKFKIGFHIDFITFILLLLTIMSYAFNIFHITSYRFGIRINVLFYSAPTYLAAICIFLIAMNLFLNRSKNKIRITILSIILISTFRFKAIGAFSAIVILTIYVNKYHKKVNLSKLAIIGLLLLILSLDQINYYFLDVNESARNMLTLKSIEIGRDYFPFGTGFATYASYFSIDNYSPVYYLYNLNHIYGISKEYSNFVSDVFWPMILGQFGFLGLMLYIFILINIFKIISNDFDSKNQNIYLAKLVCFIYLIISSTAESSFVNPMAMSLALIIGISHKNRLIKKVNLIEQ